MRKITVPGFDNPIEFPDSMSDAEIVTAIERDLLPMTSRTWGQAAGDVGRQVKAGFGDVLSGAGFLTGSKGLQQYGEEVSAAAEAGLSPYLKYKLANQQAAIDAAQAAGGEWGGFKEALGSTLTSPDLLLAHGMRTVPSILGGGVGGMAVKGGAKLFFKEATEATLRRAGTGGMIATNAALQGADVGADTYTRAIESGASEEQAMSIGREAAMNAAVVSLGTQFLPGGSRLESTLFGGLKGTGTRGALGGFAKGLAGESYTEGLEEYGGRVAGNVAMQEIAPETPWYTGAGQAGGMGAAMGGLFGGTIGAFGGHAEGSRAQQEEQARLAKQAADAAQADALNQGFASGTLMDQLLPGMEGPMVSGKADVQARQASQRAMQDVAAEAQARGLATPEPVMMERQRDSKARIAVLERQRDAALQRGNTDEAAMVQNEIIAEIKNLRAYGGATLQEEQNLRAKLDKLQKAREANAAELSKAKDEKDVEANALKAKDIQLKISDLESRLRTTHSSLVDKKQTAFDFEAAPTPGVVKAVEQARVEGAPAEQMEMFGQPPQGPQQPEVAPSEPFSLGVSMEQPSLPLEPVQQPRLITTDTLKAWGLPSSVWGGKNANKGVAKSLVGLDLNNDADVATVKQVLGDYANRTKTFGLADKIAQMEEVRNVQGELPMQYPEAMSEEERAAREAFRSAPAGTQREMFGREGAEAEAQRLTGEPKPAEPTPSQPTIDDLLGQLTAARAAKDADAVADVEEMARQLYPSQWTQAKYNNLSRRQGKLDFGAKRETEPVPSDTEEGLRGATERPAGEPSMGVVEQPETGAAAEGVAPSGDRGLGDVGVAAETGAARAEAQPSTLTEEKPDAVQEPSAEKVPARKRAKAGKRVGEEVPSEVAPAEEAKAEEKVEPKAEAKAEPKVDPAKVVADLNEISKREKNSEKGKRARAHVSAAKQGNETDLRAAQAFVEDNKVEPKPVEKKAESVEDYEAKLAAENDKDAPSQRLIEAYENKIAALKRGKGKVVKAEVSEAVAAQDEGAGEAEEVAAREGVGKPLRKIDGGIGNTSEKLTEAIKAGNLRDALRAIRSDTASFNPFERLLAERLLASGKFSTLTVVPKGSLGDATLGQYVVNEDAIRVEEGAEGANTLLHEAVHGYLHAAIMRRERGEFDHPALRDLDALYQYVKKNHPELADAYGMKDVSEFASEAMSNPEFQVKLHNIEYAPRKRKAFGYFVDAVLKLFGIDPSKRNTALMEAIISVAEAMPDTRAVQTSTVGTGEFDTVAPSRKQAPAQPTAQGQSAQAALRSMQHLLPTPATKPPIAQRLASILSAAKAPTAETAVTRADRFETQVFSADSAMWNAVGRELKKQGKSAREITGAMLERMSTSQALHANAPAHEAILRGGMEYDKETYTWKAVDRDASFLKMSAQLHDIAKKYGMSMDEAEQAFHLVTQAARMQEVNRWKQSLRDDADNLMAAARATKDKNDAAKLRKQAQKRLKQADSKFVHMTDAEIAAGLDMFKTLPELRDVVKTWEAVRNMTVKIMGDTGVYSKEQAQDYMDSIAYVPFFREEQLANYKGPKEFLRGLQVQRDARFKGSKQPVNDILDNMARFVQYGLSRSILNQKAVDIVDYTMQVMPAGFVQQVGSGGTPDVVHVLRDGKTEYYKFADPIFADTFKSLGNAAIPSIKVAAEASNMLRRFVVLNPLFGLSQVPQDAIGAIFSSGLSPRYAFSIPARAAKEFLLTLAGKSKTHEALKAHGVVGVPDYNAAIARNDAEVVAGLRSLTPLGMVKGALNRIAMASDNAVRQAVYEASMAAGLTKAEAMSKAFEIINFKRRGTSAVLNTAANYIPFFNAYLQAQNVAYKTITGKGITPVERRAALENFAITGGIVLALSMFYAATNADDEDYLNMDPVVRDRMLVIPGSGGITIPMRPDAFSLFKALGEHMYLLLTDNGTEDPAKFRKAMSHAVTNAVLGPTAVPQMVKPALEVATNHNFFTGRPLVSTGLQARATSEQFAPSTSELGKLIGSSGLISPIAADHLLRGYFGSVGGLATWISNGVLDPQPGVSRPEAPSLMESMATFPGASAFFHKEYGTGLKNDFYDLKNEVDEVVNTYNAMKKTEPERAVAYVTDEDRIKLYAMQSTVNNVSEHLSKLRQNISVISNLPDSVMSAAEKGRNVRELRAIEQEMMRSINVKELRRIAGMW